MCYNIKSCSFIWGKVDDMTEKNENSTGSTGSTVKAPPKDLIKVYRHELKFFISFTNQKILAETLRGTLELDPNGDENNEYWIRSLYFDTLEHNDFYDKEIGVTNRKKIRIRLYDVNQKKVKVEIKNKFEQYMLKETASLPREDAEELIRGNKEILLNHNNQILNRLYYLLSKDHYRPAIIIDYEREAYIGPIQDIRITFDKNIRAGGIDFNIFDGNLNLVPVFDEPTMVVEVKYNRFMPTWITDILSTFHAERYAISKYCLGRYLLF
ncbi:MAG: polyphosphate polymerase domain-containing protein [bacterium]|nr:polyphosphate polymerase domain-containing protein [bacterium]